MARLHELAAAQHGVVTRGQLAMCGMAPSTISDWARNGRLLGFGRVCSLLPERSRLRRSA